MIEQNRESHLPPGQVATRKFPVVGERSAGEHIDLDHWSLEIEGLVEHRISLSYQEILEMAQSKLVADIHCVTGWSRPSMEFTGIPLREVLELAKPSTKARFISFEAYSSRDHDTSLPYEVAVADTWLVHSANGEPLSPEHGFPLRTVTPTRYFYKSLKWVRRIEMLGTDRLGYWERESSYHNVGDPWPGDQRFSTGSVRPEQLARLRAATNFARFRNRVHLGLDLRGWEPKSNDLSRMQLKNCSLRGARFANLDLRESNLSLSDLRGADLRRSDLRGADLEGANLAGADLRGACLDDTLLSATRFFETSSNGKRVEALIDGLSWSGTAGLLESQESFLLRRE